MVLRSSGSIDLGAKVTSIRSGFSQPMNFGISVVIPAFNEEKNIGNVLRHLNNVGYGHVLVIDGLSTDGTLKVAAENGAKIVLQDGRGKGQAVRQALSNNYLDSDALV